jgi:HD-GYP domain-containing protein (c-di-GMP phosphodiesterase class II)
MRQFTNGEAGRGLEGCLKNYALKDIPAGSVFSEPVYLDDQFILTVPVLAFSEDLRSILVEWEFGEVHSDGEPCKDGAETDISQTRENAEKTIANDAEKVQKAEQFYAGFLKHVESIFIITSVNKELHFDMIADKVKEMCDIVREPEQRRYLLRVMKSESFSTNYLASHALKSAIISITIGHFIKLPTHRLIELGVAALLHEIGMSKLPPQLYLAKRELIPAEKKALLSHPLKGFQILKEYNFPLAVSLAALEHHERENGEGYPRKLTGDKISLYSKIIAVACSYEALTSMRPYRQAEDYHKGIVDLMKNAGKQYDDTIVRALVFSLSIYPIGLYVLLSNGKKAQVVDVNPENPRFPTVQLIGELTPAGKNTLLETSPKGTYIARPLQREEVGSA